VLKPGTYYHAGVRSGWNYFDRYGLAFVGPYFSRGDVHGSLWSAVSSPT
jgi:hypothetical protein